MSRIAMRLMDRERDRRIVKGWLERASFMLQVVSDILGNEFFQGTVKILLPAIYSPHIPIPDDFAVLAATEAERKITAGEAIFIFPVIEPVGSAAVVCIARHVADTAFFSADHAGALEDGPVVIYN